jgi:hypothetical protein
VITALSTLTDIAFAVCTALERAGFVAVLTGGSAATFYAPDAYQSKDLDFVITLRGQAGEEALKAIGFDPLLVAATSADFHLQASSPAIDKGTSITGLTTDIDGTSRPQGTAFDIGSYEYTLGASSPPPPAPPTHLTATPL